VAWVFLRQPVPRRLLRPMLRAAVVDVDCSTNQWFIRPCLESFGVEAVEAGLHACETRELPRGSVSARRAIGYDPASGFARGTHPTPPVKRLQ
jgi:hypothetical protein